MSTELSTRPVDPLALIATAIEKGLDAGQLRELLALRREYEADEAKKGFAAALVKFQEICPRIMKRHTATVVSKRTDAKYSYAYASFDDIMRAIAPALDETGLSVSFTTSIPYDKAGAALTGLLSVTCYIRWGTHVEERHFTLPIPEMTVNDAQRFGAAVSYGKRYALTAALNLTTTDVDDDARGLADVITADQATELKELIERKGRTLAQAMKFLQVEAIEDMNSRSFTLAKDWLNKLPNAQGGYQ